MSSRFQPVYRRFARHYIRVLATSLLLTPGGSLQAQTSGTIQSPALAGYLAGSPIGYQSPLAPRPDAPGQKADYTAVLKAQSASEWRKQEAYEDAGAYPSYALLSRFSQAAGTNLGTKTTPVLAYVLRRMLIDLTGTKGRDGVTVDSYIVLAKKRKQRERPFVTHPSIKPCQTDYLYPDADHSYPSGHAAEGEIAGELLAAVMPERAALLRERGRRFGDNRLVCGVHYPSDVAEGRRIAAAYFKAVKPDPVFAHELDCAIDERRRAPGAPTKPLPTPGMAESCKDVLDAAQGS